MCRTLAAMSPEISGTKSAPNAPRAVNKFIKYFNDLTAQVQNSFHTIHSQETKKRVRAQIFSLPFLKPYNIRKYSEMLVQLSTDYLQLCQLIYLQLQYFHHFQNQRFSSYQQQLVKLVILILSLCNNNTCKCRTGALYRTEKYDLLLVRWIVKFLWSVAVLNPIHKHHLRVDQAIDPRVLHRIQTEERVEYA